MDKKLSGKVAIVTGASSGIGKATAIALAKEGAKVALAARRIDKLDNLKKQITEFGGIAICVQTDVTQRDQVRVSCVYRNITDMLISPPNVLSSQSQGIVNRDIGVGGD